MTPEEEKQWWYQIINDLRKIMSIQTLADELDVSERTICNWQNGERPMGMKAIRAYVLHVKHCNAVHRNALPSAADK